MKKLEEFIDKFFDEEWQNKAIKRWSIAMGVISFVCSYFNPFLLVCVLICTLLALACENENNY